LKKRVSETESEPGTGASGFKEQDLTPKNRDRQRSPFYCKLDELFPGLKARYVETYGEVYNCPSPNADGLYKRFHELCAKYGISTSVKPSLVPSAAQPELFD